MIACEHNVVARATDATAHAEVHAIRVACGAVGSTDLSGCDIYCTCEPCVMCFGACYWAKVSTIYFGAGIGDKFALGLPDFGSGPSFGTQGTGAHASPAFCTTSAWGCSASSSPVRVR